LQLGLYCLKGEATLSCVEPETTEKLAELVETLENTGCIDVGRFGRLPVAFWAVVDGRVAKTLCWTP